MPLTDAAIRAAQSQQKAYKLFDERGLFLLVTPAGARLWRLKYVFEGREKLISLGDYRDVPLRRAREKRDEARRLIADGKDPSAERQAARAALSDTLESVAREWLAANKARLAPSTFAKRLQRFEAFVFPQLGRRPIRSIAAPELLAVLKRIEGRGLHESAHRVRSECGAIFRYAIATGRAERDISADLRGALVPCIVRNHAAITEPTRIGELLRAIDGYRGQPATETALKLAPILFVRPGELRGARWIEINLDGKEPEWRIPAERMKARQPHIVPLARQAVVLLRELHPITGPDGFVFPSLTTPARPISENTVNASLRRLGFAAGEMTGHGFRSMASTRLNEMGFPPDVIELQLAHAERDEVRGAYNRATRMAERRKMMQKWADYLDGLRRSGNVVSMNRGAA